MKISDKNLKAIEGALMWHGMFRLHLAESDPQHFWKHCRSQRDAELDKLGLKVMEDEANGWSLVRK